jgi:serine/threonine protein kinase
MAKNKVDTFFDLLLRSGLVDKDQLNGALLQMKKVAAGKPVDVDFVSSYLLEAGLITRWQCDKLLEGKHKGFFIGKYKLLGHIGSGGMSHVFLAQHVLMRRRVAIKILPKSRVQDSSYLQRFHREAQAAAALDHRNIVRAYDVDHDGDTHYIVMEFIEGQDLQALVKKEGPLDYARAADFVRQAAEGLAHAHEAGLIHRDVKPANLLLDRHNVVKVLDLGLARFSGDDKASLTVAYDENVLGTADYLAPEQARDSHGVDARADIYSLGCSFYFLLVGAPPFPDGTLPQRLIAHQKQQPPDVRLKRRDAPVDLLQICLRMMAKKPANRYQSTREVADVLAEWLNAHGHPVESQGTPGSSKSGMHGAAAIEVDDEATSEGDEDRPHVDIWSSSSSGGSASVLPQLDVRSSSKVAHESDTVPKAEGGTVAGGKKNKSATKRILSGSEPDLKALSLPVAKPLEEEEETPPEPAGVPGVDLVLDFGPSAAQRYKPKTLSDIGQKAAAGKASPLEMLKIRLMKQLGLGTGRKQDQKMLVWGTIIGGSVLALILLVLLMIFHR